MKKILISALLAAMVLTGTNPAYCSSLLDFFPYKKGDQVRFERLRSEKEKDIINMVCLGIVQLEGKEVLAARHARGQESWKYYFSVSQDEIAEIAYQAPQSSPSMYDNPLPIMKTPIRLGETWKGGNGAVAKVGGVNESIVTPGGVFDGCIKIEISYTQPNRKSTRWYCPGYGLVKKVQTGPLGERRTYLLEYIRNPQASESGR